MAIQVAETKGKYVSDKLFEKTAVLIHDSAGEKPQKTRIRSRRKFTPPRKNVQNTIEDLSSI